jgi:hypothetical protein
MRSDKVSEALNTLQNRFLLCRIASKAVRSFHKPSTRIQDTMNEVLDKIAVAERRDFLAEQDKKGRPRRQANRTLGRRAEESMEGGQRGSPRP